MALRHLTDAQILYQRGTIPDAILTLKHSLVQEAAYSSILRSRLKKIHADVARALVDHIAAVAIKQPELLCYHYERADMFPQAIEHAQQAGEQLLSSPVVRKYYDRIDFTILLADRRSIS